MTTWKLKKYNVTDNVAYYLSFTIKSLIQIIFIPIILFFVGVVLLAYCFITLCLIVLCKTIDATLYNNDNDKNIFQKLKVTSDRFVEYLASKLK